MKMPLDYPAELESMIQDPYKRNEFIFGCVMVNVFKARLLNQTAGLTDNERLFIPFL